MNPNKTIRRSLAFIVQLKSYVGFRASTLFLLVLLISGCEVKKNQFAQNSQDAVTKKVPQTVKSTNAQMIDRDDLVLVSYFQLPESNVCPFMVNGRSPYCLKVEMIPEGFDQFRIIRNNFKSGSAISNIAGEHCNFDTCIVLNGIATNIDAAQDVKNYVLNGTWLMSLVFYKRQISGYSFYSIDTRSSYIEKNCYIFNADIWEDIDDYCKASGSI